MGDDKLVAQCARMGQAGIEQIAAGCIKSRGGGVTGVPGPPQGIDEGRSAGEVECDELGHPPVA